MNTPMPVRQRSVTRRDSLPPRKLRAGAGILFLTAAAFSLIACNRAPATRPPAASLPPTAQVQVKAAENGTEVTTEEVVGTVRARLHATLEAKLSGRIDELPVVLGQKVQAGQLVAHLDAAEVKARFEQAQAGLRQAERDWKRISLLYEGQAVTRSEYDAADSRLQFSKASVAEAQAMLAYVEVRAPFDGVVTKKWAELGDLAVPGKPLLDIENPSALQLEADVPDAIADHVHAKDRLQVRIGGRSAALVGVVSEIAPAADPVTRTLRVKLDLPQTAGVLSGQFARLLLPLGVSESLRVPSSAVVQRGQLEIVFVVADQQAQLHLVKTGKRFGDQTEVLAGIDPGDVVVTEGAALLTDGQPVEVK